MPKITKFSKTQEILDTNDWEGLRIINEKSKTTKLVADKLRDVVKRLLSKSEGQYNINDFEFLVTDEEYTNAFYISDSKTKNGKNIVSISSDLINFCKNEDEFAGLIGHELGHFIYDKLSKSGENTVFQERGSDLHSVDLLIDGGYNPIAYEDIAGRIFLHNYGDILRAFGDHGNNFARVEDIRAYLTYLKKEKGEFNKTNKFETSSWKLFQKQFNESFSADRFQSYLDQKFIDKIGTNVINIDNLSKALDIITDEIKSGNIEISSRVSDLTSKLKLFHKNNSGYIPNKEITDKLQNIVEIITKNNKSKLFRVLDRLLWINKESFSLFGEFLEIAIDMQKFIDAKDISEAENIAKKWDPVKINEFQQYNNIFDFPSFIMPREEKAIGKELPYKNHKEWAKTSPQIKRFLEDVFRINGDGIYYQSDKYLTKTKWPDNKSYAYILGEDGNIFLTGQEVVAYKDKEYKRNLILKSKENHIRFTNQLDLLNALVDFDNNKITATDFWEIYSSYYKKTDNYIIDNIVDYYYEKIPDNKYKQEDYELVMNSRAYKEFAQIPDSLKLALEETKDYSHRYNKNTDIITVFIDSVFRKEANINFFKNITNVLLKLIEQTEETDLLKKAQLTKELYKTTTFYLSGKIYEYDVNSLKYISDEIKKLQDIYLDKIRDKYADFADPVRFFYDFGDKEIGLKSTINKQLHNNEETPLLDKIFDKLGVSTAENPKQYLDNKMELIYQLRRYNYFAIGYYFVKCLKQDLPIIDDLEYFFDYRNNKPYISGESFEKDELAEYINKFYILSNSFEQYKLTKYINKPYISGESFEQDELAKYIKRHNLFPKNNFAKAFTIYKHMESLKWFSKNESNQSEILDVLINNIKQMNIDEREKYSFMLLTGVSNNNIRENVELRFPNQKNELMNIFIDSIYEQYGKDDGSKQYEEKVSDIINLISKDSKYYFMKKYFPESWIEDLTRNEIISQSGESRDILSKQDKAKLFRLLSDKIVSQKNLSQILGKKRVVAVGDKDAQLNDFNARIFEGFLAFLEQSNKRSVATIEFLNRKLTPDSINKFGIKMNDGSVPTELQEKYLNKEFLELVYNSFWTEDLGFRSIVMNKLLNRISNNSNEDKKTKDQIAYVCNMHFPKDDKYRKDAELIFEMAIMAFEPFERSLILSAIASADENKDSEHKNAAKSVGAGLRMFFENMGPAWIKFGQLLSYVPELPSEIREDLGKLKDKADIPPRWELFDSIKNTLPNELQENIISVDEILGAGSFWVTAKIKYVDVKTGNVQDKVLSLLRPYALEKSRSGFKVIEKAVHGLAERNGKYKSLLKVARQAKASAEYEVDVVHGNKQFEKAKELYGDISININGEKFTPNVANWEYYGVGKDKVGYKIMELARGKTLDKASTSSEEKRKMALAYVAIELTNLFKGDVWDIDRHMGQQNFDKISDGNYNINIYDTGAQMNKAPGKTDKILLAEVLYGLIRAARTSMPMDQQILKTIKNMDKLETYLKVDTNYVADVQKGLLALSDIIEYQKEIKDKDGNIIQESLSLSEEDLSNVLEAVFENPSAEKTIKMSLAGKVMLNKLRPLRKGWISSLQEGVKKNSKNPVKIELKPFISETNSVNFDKPESEISDIINNENSEKILGINRKYIKNHSSDIPFDKLTELKSLQIA
jgi:hypothetical protein